MKKLIALILILTFILSGCDFVSSLTNPDIGDTPSGDTSGDNTNDSTDDNSDDSTDNGTDDDTGDGSDDDTDDSTDDGSGDCTVSHTDADDNGVCDVCRVSVLVWYDFYAINDLHGKVTDGDTQPGIDELTTYLENAVGSKENVVILSSGDMWQGSSESNLTHGLLVTEWMNEMDIVSMTLGNHEFDWGDEYIYENLELAEFPFLAINIYDRKTSKQMDYCESSIIVDKGGFRIGIIGAIGDCYTSISGEVVGDVYFKVGSELTELVKQESERLRAEGADFIIYSIHDGYGRSSSTKQNASVGQLSSYYDSSLSNGYVDLVFEAHTHQSYILSDIYGVYHIQGGGENDGISHARVSINSANGNTTVAKAEVIKSQTYASSESSDLIEDLLTEYEELIAPAYEVLGFNSRDRDDSEVEQLVADLYYQCGIEKWGEEYDVVLGGGFLRTRNPYNLYTGEVTYSDIYSILPFDNELVLCSITGYDLYYKFVNSSNSDYYVSYDESLTNIDFSATYYIITDTYTSTYAPNNLTEIARYATGIYARDLVADYIKAGNWE